MLRNCPLLRKESALFSGEFLELRYQAEAQAALVTMHHHGRLNAVSVPALLEWQSVVKLCGAPTWCGGGPLRSVVIASSVPGVFCAGADLKERRAMPAADVERFIELLQRTWSAVEDLAVPTIAAVEGAALGGGLELALCADLRVAGAAATFGFPEVGWGIFPGGGGAWRAAAVVGTGHAAELVLLADRIGADRAERMGLVNKTVPQGAALEAALEWATTIATRAPIAVRQAKKGFRRAAERDAALLSERERYRCLLESADRQEGLAAFHEKRKPRFTGA